MKKKSLKNNLSTILLVIILIAGVGLLAYPTVSDYWNSLNQTQAIAGYTEAVSRMNTASYGTLLKQAKAYNKKLAKEPFHLELSKKEEEEYNATLNVPDTEVIATIEIQKIHCSLPIYHGTEDSTLQTAIGHIAGTSLPVGGKSTHCVLSGHRGLPSARLFTDLDKMEKGDTFVINTLNETLTYEVDQILIVKPDETDALQIEEGKDLCTLVTCTPYGVNSHRLLVRGHRVKNASALYITSDGVQIEPIFVTPAVAAPILITLIILLLVDTKRRKQRKETMQKEREKIYKKT